MSRREFAAALASVPALPAILRQVAPVRRAANELRVRAITAGITLPSLADPAPLAAALAFVARAKAVMVDAGYEVQTVRVAIDWRPDAASATGAGRALERWRALDAMADEAGAVLSTGPVDRVIPLADAAAWIGDLVSATRRTSASISVAGGDQPGEAGRIRAAADTILRLATVLPQGLGNFRFAAAAHVPPGTPFFPVAWHQGVAAFSIGMEGAGLVASLAGGDRDRSVARQRLRRGLDTGFAPVARLATGIERRERRRYLGIDASPAPGLDRSIGEAVETLSGHPFGSPATLAACALITDALRSLGTRTCGYSGLMLPVLEDPVLARRATEGRYGMQQLLLYSSVCGTGLDVVPVPGDTTSAQLESVIGDVAALSTRWNKPLSVRLLPMPGLNAGDRVHYDDPILTDSVVLPVA
jgi:uncharacterized protein (UPF0210 family)